MQDPSSTGAADLVAVRRVATIAMAVLAGVLARPILIGVPQVEALATTPLAWVVISGWAALAGALLVVCSSGPGTAMRAVVRSVGFGFAFGILAAGASFATLIAMQGAVDLGATARAFVAGLPGGAVIGGLRGIGFGIAVAPIVSLLATRADFTRRVNDLPAFARAGTKRSR